MRNKKKMSKKALKHMKHERSESPAFEKIEDMKESFSDMVGRPLAGAAYGGRKMMSKIKNKGRAIGFSEKLKRANASAQNPDNLRRGNYGKNAIAESHVASLMNLMESGQISMLLRKNHSSAEGEEISMSVINRVKLREASIGFLKKSRSFKPTPNTVAIAGRSHIPSVKKGLGEKPSLRLRNSIVERGKLMESSLGFRKWFHSKLGLNNPLRHATEMYKKAGGTKPGFRAYQLDDFSTDAAGGVSYPFARVVKIGKTPGMAAKYIGVKKPEKFLKHEIGHQLVHDTNPSNTRASSVMRSIPSSMASGIIEQVGSSADKGLNKLGFKRLGAKIGKKFTHLAKVRAQRAMSVPASEAEASSRMWKHSSRSERKAMRKGFKTSRDFTSTPHVEHRFKNFEAAGGLKNPEAAKELYDAGAEREKRKSRLLSKIKGVFGMESSIVERANLREGWVKQINKLKKHNLKRAARSVDDLGRPSTVGREWDRADHMAWEGDPVHSKPRMSKHAQKFNEYGPFYGVPKNYRDNFLKQLVTKESSIIYRANLREAGITDIAAQRERLHKLKLRLLKSSVKKSYPVSDPKEYRPNATTGRYTHRVGTDTPHATVTDHKMGTVSYADPDMVKAERRKEVFPEWYKESSIISRGILREAALFGGVKKTNLPISDKVKSPDLRMKRKAKKSELPVAKSGEVYDPSWLYGMKNPYNN